MGSPDAPVSESDRSCLATVSAFVAVLYVSGWVIPDFDWGSWQRTEEGSHLRAGDDGLETATAGQLVKVLTAIVRYECFVDGVIDAAIADRALRRVLARAAQLAREIR